MGLVILSSSVSAPKDCSTYIAISARMDDALVQPWEGVYMRDSFDALGNQIKLFADDAAEHPNPPRDLPALAATLGGAFDRELSEILPLLEAEWKKRGLRWIT